MQPLRAQLVLIILCAAFCGVTSAQTDQAVLTTEQLERAAADVALWGMPLASFDAMRQAIYRDLNVGYNSPIFWSDPANASNQSITPAVSVFTLLVFFNTQRSGPMVIDVPPAKNCAIFGSLISAWNSPLIDIGSEGADRGLGGKFVLFGPESSQDLSEGFVAVATRTFNNYAMIRFVPLGDSADHRAAAMDTLRRVRIYPLEHWASPQPRRFTDAIGRRFNAHVQFDLSLYRGIARMLREEPSIIVPESIGQSMSKLGIQFPRRFDPDEAQQQAMLGGALKAQSLLQEAAADFGQLIWSNRQWRTMFDEVAQRTRMTFQEDQRDHIDSRAVAHFLQIGPVVRPELVPVRLVTFRDSAGELLTGDHRYTFTLPQPIARNLRWSVTAFDAQTCAFFPDAARTRVASSDPTFTRNADASVTLEFGAPAPVSPRVNRIPIPESRQFFVMLELHGDAQVLTDATTHPADLVRASDSEPIESDLNRN